MEHTFSREELLRHLIPLMHDPQHAEALQHMSDAQLRVIAEALDSISSWKPERRGEARKPVTRRIQIGPLEGNGFKPQYGLQEDISDRGIGVFLNRAIPVGTRVRIVTHGQPDSSGTVRRCQQDKSGWIIGILVDQTVTADGGTAGESSVDSAASSDPSQTAAESGKQP